MFIKGALQFCLVISIFFDLSLSTEEQWMHHAVLDPEGHFHLYWTLEEAKDSISFKVEGATKGYLGFGLSPNGGMAGSDIVTGWVKDGEVFFQDRHAEGKFMPEEDDSQDWDLLSGSENDTHTSLSFRRKLKTCDHQDMEIDGSTMRAIYAYSDVDPVSPKNLTYHSKRGSRSLMLLQPKVQSQVDTQGLAFWDVQSPNFTINSGTSSIYWCKIVKGPELSKKHHILRIEPLLQAGNEGYVHHMLMYECPVDSSVDFEYHLGDSGHQCYHPNMPDAMKMCDGVFAAWGVGGEPLVFPDHVGMPLNPSPPKYYLLEIHYDNPLNHGNITDHSGLRIFYTPELRQHEAGTLMIGSAVSPRMIIPPRLEKFVTVGHSNPDCLGPAMNGSEINLLGIFLHAHLLGRRLTARHFRHGEELKPLADNSNYDFNYQDYMLYSEEIKMQPNDQITVECTYNSTGRSITTFGGISTNEEMCLAFVLYYPRIEVFASLSVATMALVNGLTGLGQKNTRTSGTYSYNEFFKGMGAYDWDRVNPTVIEDALRYSPHDTYCYIGNGNKTTVQSMISYPRKLKPYKETSVCDTLEGFVNETFGEDSFLQKKFAQTSEKAHANAVQNDVNQITFAFVIVELFLVAYLTDPDRLLVFHE